MSIIRTSIVEVVAEDSFGVSNDLSLRQPGSSKSLDTAATSDFGHLQERGNPKRLAEACNYRCAVVYSMTSQAGAQPKEPSGTFAARSCYWRWRCNWRRKPRRQPRIPVWTGLSD